MKASEILVSVGEPMSFPEHLSSPAWPLLASLSAFWLRVSEKLSSLRNGDRVTLRHEKSKRKWQKKKGEISKSVDLLYFAPVFDDSIWYQFPVSQHVFLSPPRSRGSDESYSWASHYSGGALWWWHAHTHARTNTHTQASWCGFQWGVWLDTGYSWCLSGGSNQSYWAALLPLMVCIIRYKTWSVYPQTET